MHHTLQKMADAIQGSDKHKEYAREIVAAMARDNLSYAQALGRVEHMMIVLECADNMIMHSYKHKIRSDQSKIDIATIEHWDR